MLLQLLVVPHLLKQAERLRSVEDGARQAVIREMEAAWVHKKALAFQQHRQPPSFSEDTR